MVRAIRKLFNLRLESAFARKKKTLWAEGAYYGGQMAKNAAERTTGRCFEAR
jgi:hypothetical protein